MSRKPEEEIDLDNVIACHQCDLLVEAAPLPEGSKAHCPRCGHTLRYSPKDGLLRPLAIAIAALIFLVLANLFPFMVLRIGGQEQIMTLFEGSIALHTNGYSLIAVIFLSCTVLVPAAILVMVTYLLLELLGNQKQATAFPYLARGVFTLIPWAMADVFIVGVLVSLIKIASLASVEMGISFWMYVASTILFTWTLGTLDRDLIWSTWERRRHAV